MNKDIVNAQILAKRMEEGWSVRYVNGSTRIYYPEKIRNAIGMRDDAYIYCLNGSLESVVSTIMGVSDFWDILKFSDKLKKEGMKNG